MGLLFRRRRPLMRLAGAAAVGGIAYHAGKSHEQQAAYNEQASDPYAATQGAPAPAPAADPTDELERLASLHQSGALGDSEFAAAKSKILGI